MVAIVGRRGPVRAGAATQVARRAPDLPRGHPLVFHPVTACTLAALRFRHLADTASLEAVSQLDLGSGEEMPTFNVENVEIE